MYVTHVINDFEFESPQEDVICSIKLDVSVFLELINASSTLFWLFWECFLNAPPPPPPTIVVAKSFQRIPPLVCYNNIHFWLTNQKIFKGAFGDKLTIFEGGGGEGGSAEKTQFFGQNFPISAFLAFFCLRRRNLPAVRGAEKL